ncbi:hypothetical protein GGF46_000061 [Coemansia sp. RSA 552]|nr:hypothetical protein GGF46_000061 [Coemansia sp. RSA 552]
MLEQDKAPASAWSMIKATGTYSRSRRYTSYGHVNTVNVDRTLLCKAFLDASEQVTFVCVPRGFGASYNIHMLKRFFNVLGNREVPYTQDSENNGRMEVDGDEQGNTPATRAEDRLYKAFESRSVGKDRMVLFKGSLLEQEMPAFFEEHFCRYPVIHIDFRFDLSSEQKATMDELQKIHCNQETRNLEDKELAGVAFKCFAALSGFITDVFGGRYILLVENYDAPLTPLENKPWAEEARQVYLSLLNDMLVDNKSLLKGFVTGVHKFPFASSNSSKDSPGGIRIESPALDGYLLEQPPAPTPAGAMFGFKKAEVDALLEVCADGLVQLGHSPDRVLNMLSKMGGYDFGVHGIRYNPKLVFTFLEEMRAGRRNRAPLLRTMIQGITRDLIAAASGDRRMDMLLFTSRLVQDFSTGRESCHIHRPSSAVPALQQSAADEQDIELGPNTLISSAWADTGGAGAFVKYLVGIGYLTIGTGDALRIPNALTQALWLHVLQTAAFGTDLQVHHDTGRQQLLGSLFSGDVSNLGQDIEFVLSQPGRPGGVCSEASRLELVCRYITSKLGVSIGTATGSSSVLCDYDFLADPYAENAVWKVTVVPLGRYIERFTIVVGFAPVDAGNSAALAAQRALDKVTAQVGTLDLSCCDRRLDIGVAIYNNTVALQQRLWKRDGDGDFAAAELGQGAIPARQEP